MPAEIITVPVYDRSYSDGKGTVTICTVAKSQQPWCQLSPFLLGPCYLYDGAWSRNMENAWQYAKVYRQFCSSEHPKSTLHWDNYFDWAEAGWSNPRAVRYPMGKGAKPLFSLWANRRLSYVQARKAIYGPLYAEAVQKTEAWTELVKLYKTMKRLVLYDYDVRDVRGVQTYTEVLNDPDKKMGHAFVLAMLLTNDKALNQMELR